MPTNPYAYDYEEAERRRRQRPGAAPTPTQRIPPGQGADPWLPPTDPYTPGPAPTDPFTPGPYIPSFPKADRRATAAPGGQWLEGLFDRGTTPTPGGGGTNRPPSAPAPYGTGGSGGATPNTEPEPTQLPRVRRKFLPGQTNTQIPGLDQLPEFPPTGTQPGQPGQPPGPGQPSPQTGQYRSMLQGFDFTKLDDETHVTPKYQFARIAQDYPPTPAGLQAMANDPRFAAAGFTYVGDDKIRLPNGEVIDVGLSFGSGGGVGWAWQPTTGAGGGGGGTTPGTGAPGSMPGMPGGGGAPGAGGGGGAGGGIPGGFQQQLYARILALMNQDPNSATSSPTYTNAMSAYDTQAEREAERTRNAVAERMEASGQSGSGAYDQALLGVEQRAGEQRNTFAANLAVQQLTEQRDQIMEALSLGANLMTEEQRLALQERLGLLNASIQQWSLQLQNQQFNDTLGWQMSQWQYLQNLLPFLYGM
jgi:hypothetical protein